MLSENTLNVEDAGELLTIVTISKTPVVRKDLKTLPYINEVYLEENLNSRHQAFINAIKKVKTPFVVFLNKFDEFKSDIYFPLDNKGMSYGDLNFGESWGNKKLGGGPFMKSTNIENPYNIRRAILRTEYVQPILEVTKDKSLDTETILYTLIPILHGHDYFKDFNIFWSKSTDVEFGKLAYNVKGSTEKYIKNNLVKLLPLTDKARTEIDFSKLTDIEEFKGELTVITLSKEPFERDDIKGLDYINYVSKIQNDQDYYTAIKLSIRKVTTPYFLFVDSDDPMPQRLVMPNEGYGLIYGDLFIKTAKNISRIKTGEFSEESFAKNPLFLHKPVYNTKLTRQVIEKIGTLNNKPHTLINYFVAIAFGAQYNENLTVVWDKGNSSNRYKKSVDQITTIGEFLSNNKTRLLNLIKPSIDTQETNV